jgi:anaerobic selenocysteine-containing dehydrogenase
MAMYHSWGSQNAWLRQIHGENKLFVNRRTGKALGLKDEDWVWIVSPHGRVKAPVKLMEGVEERTVWTWNAIGKRKGAWNLSPKAPESEHGFLLNHVIAELLPPQPDGHRYSNSDPVTGQAAWYDLKVRLEKCAPADAGETAPQFPAMKPIPGAPKRPKILRYGAGFRGRKEDAT